MNTRRYIRDHVRAFLARHGMSPRQLGLRAGVTHKFVRSLERGVNLQLETIERVEAFMASEDSAAANRADGADRAALPPPERAA